MEGLGGDIDPGDGCPQQRPESVSVPMWHRGWTRDCNLADLGADDLVQQGLAGEESVDVLVFVVGLSQSIPALLIGLGHVVHGRVLI